MTTTPNFLLWSHETLAKLAAELTEDNAMLRAENKSVLEEWRKFVVANEDDGK